MEHFALPYTLLLSTPKVLKAIAPTIHRLKTQNCAEVICLFFINLVSYACCNDRELTNTAGHI